MSGGQSSEWIVNTTDESFDNDVFTQSLAGPVIVDFWAEWCAPCRMLAPVLEKLVQEYQGKLTLVKANTEQTPQAANQFGVSGIPAVYAVFDGAIVDSFQGAMPEESIRQWLNSLLGKVGLASALKLAETEPHEGERRLRELLQANPNESLAAIALAQLLVAGDHDEEARELISELERRGFLEPDAERVKARLDLKAKAHVDLHGAQAEATENPGDFSAQLRLAEALAGQGKFLEAFEICLQLVSMDRKQTGERARELMVDVFRVLPEDSELTSEYRRKLSMLLY
jgi:putative thioredoxin